LQLKARATASSERFPWILWRSSARALAVGTPVTLIRYGVPRAHAAVAETINYEIVCGIDSAPAGDGSVLDA
jgi:hypothetical protein